MKIPIGWHRLRRGVEIKERDKVNTYGRFRSVHEYIGWAIGDTKDIYIRRNKTKP